MHCPNCGLANDAGAKFCSNCGTVLDGAAREAQVPNPGRYTSPGPYGLPPAVGRNSTAKNIGIGCLIALLVFLFIGVSCTRACFGHGRRGYIIRRR